MVTVYEESQRRILGEIDRIAEEVGNEALPVEKAFQAVMAYIALLLEIDDGMRDLSEANARHREFLLQEFVFTESPVQHGYDPSSDLVIGLTGIPYRQTVLEPA